jgi:hypothetical protein
LRKSDLAASIEALKEFFLLIVPEEVIV